MAKSLSQTPAPAKDRIKGSKVNPKGSASSEKSATQIKFDAKTIIALNNKLKEFREKHDNKNITLNDLKAVYRRGLGAYSSSHRPTISGGKPNTRNAWAMARVNKFLLKAGGTKVKKAYVQDDDLMKYENGGEVNEEALQLIDIISIDPKNPRYAKYKDLLKSKFNIDYDLDYGSNDEKIIEYANVENLKNKKDFLNYDNYVKYAQKIFRLRGFIENQPNHIEGIVDIELASKIGKELGFEVVFKEYNGTGNYAEVLGDTIRMPKEVDINTFIHEIGHFFDHVYSKEYNGKAKNSVYATSLYFIGRADEVFAENFMTYFIAPDWLKNNLSEVYYELDEKIPNNYKEIINNLIDSQNSENLNLKYANGGEVGQDIKCRRCGWEWNTSQSEEFDKYVCHNCGFDNRTFYDVDPIGYAKGGEVDKHKETYAKWKSLVNMSYGELKKFYDSKEGKEAGLSTSEANEQGISSGRESARWIMKMKTTPKDKWTPTMWKWANKQISFISRMSGMQGELYDDKGNKTRKHTSLLIWGHNPKKNTSMKYENGGEMDVRMEDTVQRMDNPNFADISFYDEGGTMGKELNLHEYINQSDPQRNVKVNLKADEYVIGNTIKLPMGKTLTPIYIQTDEADYFNGVEYVLKNDSGFLYTTDADGNPKSRSVFYIDDKYAKGGLLKVYHHTDEDIKDFSESKGVWVTTNSFAYPFKRGTKYKIEKYINPKELNLASEKNVFESGGGDYKKGLEEIKKQGYDGVKRIVGGDKEFYIFDKSKFIEMANGGELKGLTQKQIDTNVHKIATKFKLPLEYINSQLKLGVKSEMEHTKDKSIASKIALDHLNESPYYYQKLSQMEKELSTMENKKNVYLQDNNKTMSTSQSFKEGGNLKYDSANVKEYFAHGSGNVGGVLVGKRHSEGGIKAINKSTGQPLEMEGGEVVITRNAVSDNKKREFEGEMLTNKEILSRINESGGGVKIFSEGGDIESDSCSCSGKSYKYGGKMMVDYDIAKDIANFDRKPIDINHHNSLKNNFFPTKQELKIIETNDEVIAEVQTDDKHKMFLIKASELNHPEGLPILEVGTTIYSVESNGVINDWEIEYFTEDSMVLRHKPKHKLHNNFENKIISFDELKEMYREGHIKIKGVNNETELGLLLEILKSKINSISNFKDGGLVYTENESEDEKIMKQQFGNSKI